MYAALAAIAVILIILFFLRKNNKATPSGGLTVYGTMGCGWTRKQLDYLKGKGVPFTFVDCDSEDCPGMDAFPTTVDAASGERTVGFKKF
jgi:hypothetical protein